MPPRFLPGETFAIVLTDEHTGRIVRHVGRLSPRTAAMIVKLVDGGAEIGEKVAEVVTAGRTLERAASESIEALRRAFAPLLEQKPRKLPARRKR